MLTKAVLLLVLIPTISFAQDGAAKKTDDTEASTPAEVSMADTLDFIKRKLSEPRTQDGVETCTDGATADSGPNTLKATGFAIDGTLVMITQSYSSPGSGNLGPSHGTQNYELRIDQLEPTAVAVEKGFPVAITGGRCTQSPSTWFVALKSRVGDSIRETDVSISTDPRVDEALCKGQQMDDPRDYESIRKQGMPILQSSHEWTDNSCIWRMKWNWDTVRFAFNDKQTATRVAKAFVHAIILASPKAKPDVF